MTEFSAATFKTAKSVKDAAREAAFDVLVSAFSEAFGADSVSVIGSAEIAVCVGTRILSDGTVGEVCVTVKPVSKDFDVRVTTSGKSVMPFERLVAADDYEAEKSEKECKAEERARAREVKRKADEAARAKRKAEREAEKTGGTKS